MHSGIGMVRMIEIAGIYKSPNRWRGRRGFKVDKIVLHHTAVNSFNSVKWWFVDPCSQASAHYVVDRDGSIYQFVSEYDTAWHAGVPRWQFNEKSIGIEIVQADPSPFTTAQYRAVVEIIIDCAERYDIPLIVVPDGAWLGYETADAYHGILGHSSISRSKSTCPGPLFDWLLLKETIESKLREEEKEEVKEEVKHEKKFTRTDTYHYRRGGWAGIGRKRG